MKNPFRRRRDRRQDGARKRPERDSGEPAELPKWGDEEAESSDREARRRARETRRREREEKEAKAGQRSLGEAKPARRRRGRAKEAKPRARREAARERLRGAGRASAEGLSATRRRADRLTPHVRRAGAAVAAGLRRVAAFVFRGASLAERAVRAVIGLVVGFLGATVRRLDRWVTPVRGAFALVIAAAACLVVSQFMDYRGVEVGQPAYAAVADIAEPPQRAQETPVDAHSYALIAVAAAAAALALVALVQRRWKLGRLVALAGITAGIVILAVDLPSGLDEGDATLRYEGARAVLNEAFYAELAAAAGLVLAGLVLSLDLRRSGRPAPSRKRVRRRRPRPRKSPSLAGSGS